MAFIILFIILFLLLFLNAVANAFKNPHLSTPKVCKLHKWEYDHTGHMICSECKRRPFQDERSNDEEY